VYSGVTVSYILNNRAKYRSEQKTQVLRNLTEIERLQYGVTLSLGYNTWNFYANYALTSLYKEGVVNAAGELIEMKPLRLGLIFYML
jgi:putative flippase GtrA